MTDVRRPEHVEWDMSLEERFTNVTGSVYLTGIQALVRVLLDQRRRDRAAGLNTAGYVSGYPGSPVGGVDLELARRRHLLDSHDIRHQPGLNEDLAATALWGSQTVPTLPNPTVEGVFGMWYGKSPGVDRSGDALRHANMGGTSEHGGVLVVAGDDPGAASTNFPTDTVNLFYDWGMPVLYPGNVQDIVDLGLHGYAMSRAAGLWVAFKFVTAVADGSGMAEVGLERVVPRIPEVLHEGKPFKPVLRVGKPGGPMRDAEKELFAARNELAQEYIRLNRLNPLTVDPTAARVGIVAAGKTYGDLTSAFALLGLSDDALAAAGVRVKKVSALYPVSRAEWRDFASGLDEVIVVEEKRPFMERFVKEALYGRPDGPRVIGKRDDQDRPFLPLHGELDGDRIAAALGDRLQSQWGVVIDRPNRRRELPVLALSAERVPHFCSGCPHNSSLAVPEGSLVGSGIGCHILQLVVPRPEYGVLSGFTHMGAEGAQWVGAAPFTQTSHLFQNVGDGTFHHSGSLALRFAVASKVNITYKLLYNSAVGMTGGQDVAGALPVPELTKLLEAEGVVRTIVTSDNPSRYRGVRLARNAEVRHRDDLMKAQEELATISGVTVLLHDQQCAAEKRRLRKRGRQAQPTRRVMINERVCEGCGDCNAKSQCLSVQPIETEFGRKTTIHQASCNLDESCVNGDCPSFIYVETKRARKSSGSRLRRPDIDLPEPEALPPTVVTNIVMTGIGGTGVVTTSQILATAAVLDGRKVRDLDLTGSSQKAGPVVSQLQIRSDDDLGAAAEIPEGGADLILAFDLLTAVTPANLAKGSPERTRLVASSTAVPTGVMAFDSSVPYPSLATLSEALAAVTLPDANVYIDAGSISQAALGTHMLANTVLLGAACQAGLVPVGLDSIEAAIRLNGVSIDENLAALAWGRTAVAAPGLVVDLLAGSEEEANADKRAMVADLLGRHGLDSVGPDLRRLLELRVDDLIRYQDAALAGRFLEVVGRAYSAERGAGLTDELFGAAVARGLHRLMAYKDEYEVARLHLLDSAQDSVTREFGDGAVVSWNLHPPVLRSLGLKRKMTFGSWFRPVLGALAAGRRLRGTPLDPFGYTRVRRVERALVEHYTSVVDAAGRLIRPDNFERCVGLAESADRVRGYEAVKLANVQRYLQEVSELMTALGWDVSDLPQLAGF